MFTLTVLGPKEAEMRIIGCDSHTRHETLAMLDTATGEVLRMTLTHEGRRPTAREIGSRHCYAIK